MFPVDEYRNAVMLDLETMGIGPLAAIVSVGAVRFNRDEVTDCFEGTVSLDSSVRHGMQVDSSTIMFWMKQTDKARERLLREADDLPRVLQSFSMWLGKDAKVWGNGADFDNVILASAYRLTKLPQPWKYSANRCYRTIKNLVPDVRLMREGEHHCAIDDARSQATHLIECIRHLDYGHESVSFRTRLRSWVCNVKVRK